MSDTAQRIRRLRFRAWHRGTQEMDLLMGRFADAVLEDFDAGQLDRFEALLECPDPDLYGWISRRDPVPDVWRIDVVELMLDFHNYE